MKKFVLSLFVLAGLTIKSGLLFAQGYEELPNPHSRAEAGRVEVLEYFWFGCPHCFAFEPTINKWAEDKPDYVDFVREAPPLNPSWTAHSQAFYAAQAMGVVEEFFEPFFNAIHVDRKRLNSPKKIASFAGTLGLDEAVFLKTMSSFAVDAKIRNALEMARADGIRSVPSIVVNGKYRTSGSLAGSNEKVIEVIRKLSAMEHAE